MARTFPAILETVHVHIDGGYWRSFDNTTIPEVLDKVYQNRDNVHSLWKRSKSSTLVTLSFISKGKVVRQVERLVT